ncbi:MAG: YIP1 family protein [Gemmatimonadota bacterium]|nr:YIP1 family protein [Gemmatimonadota bacterium]
MTERDIEPAVTTPPQASIFEDFVDILTSPREVFARRATSGYAMQMVIVALLLGVLFLVNRATMQDMMDAEIARGMAQAMKDNPGMTQEQLEAGKKFAGYAATAGAFVGLPLAIWMIGLGIWLVAKMLGASLTYGASALIATYAYVPRVLESIVVGAQGVLLDTSGIQGRYQLTLGVARFLDPEMSPGLLGLIGRVDVFTLWVTVLIAIGMTVIAKLPREKVIAAGALIWIYGALPALFQLAKSAISG